MILQNRVARDPGPFDFAQGKLRPGLHSAPWPHRARLGWGTQQTESRFLDFAELPVNGQSRFARHDRMELNQSFFM
jgi:hypothetical protein